MLTRKQIVKCQNMLDYLEVYDELISIEENYLYVSLLAKDNNNRGEFRNLANEANRLLVSVAKKGLNDKAIWS